VRAVRILALVLAATLMLGAVALSQDSRTKRREQDSVLRKLQQVEVWNHLLPVLLTAEQVKAILPIIEESRKADTDLADAELKQLKALEPTLDAAIKAAGEKGEPPSREQLQQILSTTGRISMARQALQAKYTEMVLEKLKQVLNAGQLKAAANSLPKMNAPGTPEPSQDELLKHWIRVILLEPEAYPILVRLSRQS